MLLDDTSTIDAHNLPIWEGLANESQGFCVEVWLGVSGAEYSPINDEEVGIRGWQSLAFEDDGPWHGQLQ